MSGDRTRVNAMIKAGIDPKWSDYPLKRAMHLGLDDQSQWIRSLMPTEMKEIPVEVQFLIK